jgi:thioredoxin 1
MEKKMVVSDVLSETNPVILMLTHGGTLNVDLTKALDAAEKSGMAVVKVNVDEQPEFAEQFEVGKHPVLVVVHNGEVISRRSRPWGTDAQEIVNQARKLVTANSLAPKKEEVPAEVLSAPIAVTDKDFAEQVLKSDLPVIVDFWADWCGPCKMVAPILDKLAKEFAGKVKVAKVDVDRNPMLSQQFRITSIPTMMFVKGGKILGQSAGAAPESAIRDVINQLINIAV